MDISIKNSACLEINFIKICPEIALKYFFEKNVVLYEIYSKKSKVTNTYVHRLDIYHSLQIIIATRLQYIKPHFFQKNILKLSLGRFL
jgi:hypothetical protein